jgi:hypothetical protein
MVCYAPSTGTLALIGVGIYVLWHKTIGHFLGMFGTVLEIALILGVEVAAAIALVWLTRAIRRRRAESGACTTCRFRCQQALAGRPNLLVNRVDRRIPAPAHPALTCHPAAPLRPARLTAALLFPARLTALLRPARLTAALRHLRPAVPLRTRPATALGPRPAAPTALTAPAATLAPSDPAVMPTPAVTPVSQAQLPWGQGTPRFMGPVPAPFSARGPVHAPVSPLHPSATRVPSPAPSAADTPAPAPRPVATPAPPVVPAAKPEAVDVDGYVLTPDGVDTAESASISVPR